MLHQNISPIPTPSARELNAYRHLNSENEFFGLETDIDRFHALRLIKLLGRDAGFTPSMIQLLEYYIVRTQDIDWSEGQTPICYQTVNATARDLGMNERHVNRLETALFELGALRWESSGNHKRYGVRNRETGEIAYAFGVDLSPLAEMLPDLEAAIEHKNAYKVQWEDKRRSISSLRSQIRALLSSLAGYEDIDMLSSVASTYQAISYRVRSHHTYSDLLALEQEHISVMQALNHLYEDMYKEHMSVNMSAMDALYVRHIQDTKNLNSSKEDTSSNSSSSNNKDFQKLDKSNSSEKAETSALSDSYREEKIESPTPKIDNITWKQVLNASSDRFRDYIPIHNRALNWNDLVHASESLLTELGIHKSAWVLACGTLGRSGAAICIMIIDQKSLAGEIRSPGGYLREMCKRAERGELNLLASVFGLLKRGENDHAC